jgi:excisionase family DNA binding protein
MELAECLGVERNTVYRRVKSGVIPCVRVGAAIRIPRSYLDQLNAQAQRAVGDA